MKKKLLVSLAIIISVIFSFTFCFAADNGNGLKDAADGVRNFVGGVENTAQNAAMDVSNTSKDITGDMEKGMDKVTGRNSNNHHTDIMGSTDGDNGRYTTSRVNTGDTTVLGMNSNAWTWLIVGIAAIAIIALIWYYSMQFTNHNRNDD